MSHSPYEPAEGIGRGVDPELSGVDEVGTEVSPGTVYGETYVAPAEDLYAPVGDAGTGTAPTGTTQAGTSAGDVKDTAADQGRRVADTAKAAAGQVKDTAVEQGQQVAAVAKDEAVQVKEQAAGSIRDIVGQGRTELASQARDVAEPARRVRPLARPTSSARWRRVVPTGPARWPTSRTVAPGPVASSRRWLVRPRAGRRAGRGHALRPSSSVGVPRRLAARRRGRGSRDPQPRRRGQGRARRAAGAEHPAAVTGPDYGPGRHARHPGRLRGRLRTTSYGTTGYDAGRRRLRRDARRRLRADARHGTTPAYGTEGYVPGDLPENPAPQTWTGGSR